MTDKDIFQEGEEAKYQIKITREEYDMSANVFEILLTWGMFGNARLIQKQDLIIDEEGNCFCIIDTEGMSGVVNAETRYYVPDTDCEDGMRTEVDKQMAFRVLSGTVGIKTCKPDKQKAVNAIDGRHVEWIRIYRSDANSLYADLLYKDRQPVKDSTGAQIKVRKHNLY